MIIIIPTNIYNAVVNENLKLKTVASKKYIDVENINQPRSSIINNNPAIIIVPIALLLILKASF